MGSNNATALEQLDARFTRIATVRDERRPHRGWIRAIRDALGMSGQELAERMDVSQSTVVDLEASEATDRIKLATLRRAADALDCDLVYFLVPRTSLEEAVWSRARTKAAQHLAGIAHHGRLEGQEVTGGAEHALVDKLAAQLVDRRGLWSDER
ncbi:MAG: mobile mystery protein A [Acidimicrobiia bacterium]|nr:mobile mystery protein A [Acidimicrobiia bacterium]